MGFGIAHEGERSRRGENNRFFSVSGASRRSFVNRPACPRFLASLVNPRIVRPCCCRYLPPGSPSLLGTSSTSIPTSHVGRPNKASCEEAFRRHKTRASKIRRKNRKALWSYRPWDSVKEKNDSPNHLDRVLAKGGTEYYLCRMYSLRRVPRNWVLPDQVLGPGCGSPKSLKFMRWQSAKSVGVWSGLSPSPIEIAIPRLKRRLFPRLV